VGAFDSTEVLREVEVGNGPTDSLGTVVLIKKHERLLLKGTNRDDQKILASIGKGLETKFGVTRHFIVGQTEEAADSKKYEHIQVLAAKNMAGVKKLRVHAEKYDMMDILIVPDVTDPSNLSLPPAAVFTLDTTHDIVELADDAALSLDRSRPVDVPKVTALLAGLEKSVSSERDVQTIAALRLHLGF
jgi:hypothetical protein